MAQRRTTLKRQGTPGTGTDVGQGLGRVKRERAAQCTPTTPPSGTDASTTESVTPPTPRRRTIAEIREASQALATEARIDRLTPAAVLPRSKPAAPAQAAKPKPLTPAEMMRAMATRTPSTV